MSRGRVAAAVALLAVISAGMLVRAENPGARAQSGDPQPAKAAPDTTGAVPSADAARAARIVIDPARFDFGTILPGKAVTREFVIRNVGATDLTLESVSSSCGCTVADGYSKVVKPASATVLRVTFTAPEKAGRVVKSVLVKSNDPTQGLVELKVEATVAGSQS